MQGRGKLFGVGGAAHLEAVAAVEAGRIAPVLVPHHLEAAGEKCREPRVDIGVGGLLTALIPWHCKSDGGAMQQAAGLQGRLAGVNVSNHAAAISGRALSRPRAGVEELAGLLLLQLVTMGPGMQLDLPALVVEGGELRPVHVPAECAVGKARHHVHDRVEPAGREHRDGRLRVEHIVVKGDQDGLERQPSAVTVQPVHVLLNGDA
jgi:hypothetical protein